MDPFRSLVSPPSSQSHDAPASSDVTSTAPTSSHSREVPPNSVLFREIHKNAWLRRLPNVEKRSGVSNKKNEKVWTVFCVHDDIHPFLEFYITQEAAMEHKPNWFVCLNTTLHVSPTIIAHEQECEFVVTLPSDVVRLAAPSWDSMMEWVDVIRSKLREMKILSPQENVYSRMPEARLPLLPTRDPNSPLPPPPTGPSALVPGVEPVHMEPADAIPTAPGSPGPVVVSSSSVTTPATTETRTASTSSSASSREAQQSSQAVSTTVVDPSPASPTPVIVSSSNTRNTVSSTYLFANPVPPRSPPGLVHPSNPLSESATPASNRNVTVIEVSVAPTQQTPCDIFNFNFVRDSLLTDAEATPSSPPGRATTVLTPSTPGGRPRPTVSPQPPTPSAPLNSPPRLWQQLTQAVSNVINPRSEPVRVSHGVTNIVITGSGTSAEPPPTTSIYEQVFPSWSTEQLLPEETRHRPVLPQLSSPPAGQIPHIELPRRRRRTSSGSEAANPRNRQPQQQPQAHLEGERRLRPAPHPFRHAPDDVEVISGSSARITLREQQVLQLRREMLHPGGVRMQLRRKDCINSIALVDAFGAVWIAGWKQRECPMLYNALHIGDQLLCTAGTPVSTAVDAQRIIRSYSNSLYVELVIRRLPFGRVFALRRDVEGQSLGISLEGGSGVIRDVAPNSPAARVGLPSRAPTCDNLSLTSWVLTEVNGRPLNLFFKDGEVRDRLNAVGTEISILVQPLDLIKQIRKQLKTLRSYKDYIVQ